MITYIEKFRTSIVPIILLIFVFTVIGCSSGGDNAQTANQKQGSISTNKSLSTDQESFGSTLYPILSEHCSSCHSEQSNQNIQLANFANGSIVIAHAVVTNRSLVNRESPEASRFVEQLVDNKHFCWSSCSDDAIKVITAIARWNDLVANDSGGVTNEVGPQTSVQAFSQSLYPVLTDNCAQCHDGSAGFSAFAAPDTELAHETTLSRGIADLNNPQDSELVKYLSDKEHNCWSDCTTNAQRVASAISEWQLLLEANPGGGDNRNPIAVNDSYTTQANVPFTTGVVLLNDSDADNDTLAISAWDTLSNQGAVITNNINGTFTYSPPTGFIGNDSFSYSISDGNSGVDSATVSIAVVENTGPVAIDDSVKTNQNTPVNITNLQVNDISNSGNALTIVSVDFISQSGGSVQLFDGNIVQYIPPTDTTGLDRFTYTISDGLGVATGQVEVDINAQPVAVSDAVYTYVNVDVNTGNVLINDRDTNNDPLVISSFDSASEQTGTVTYNGDGTFTYSPPDNFEGNDSFDYIVFDGRGGAATATVFVTVTEPVLRDDNRFLQFLDQSSPLFDEDGESAIAYYRAIDPLDQRTTLTEWREISGFNIGADAFALYINNNDLGFARRMFIRTDPVTGVVSSYVENYPTLADAQNRDNLIATVAMEYTVAPGQDPLDPDAHRYTTFYVFDGNDNRALGADLDGRGFKFVPGLCNTCHGGRPKSIVNNIYPDSGDTGAGFIPWDLDTYLFADATAAVSRANQEDQFKIFNQSVLNTNPNAAQIELIEGWYGGPDFLANTFNGGFIPEGWLPPNAPANATQLYLQVVAPSCRACHVMRGSVQQSDVDFNSFDKFMSYKHRIEELVYDEGTMPVALRTFDRFWANEFIPETLAGFLGSSKILEDDELLSPGRAIAKAGPFREAALGTVLLNGNASLFTGGNNAFNWVLVNQPAESTAQIQNADQADAFFVADVPGDYIVRLVVNDGDGNTPASPPGEVVIRVSAALRNTSFISDVAPIFDQCAVCHLGFDNPRFNNLRTLYDNAIDFVNLDDPVNSPILKKPSGQHHAGGIIPGFDTPTSEKYQLILRWILEGAPDN